MEIYITSICIASSIWFKIDLIVWKLAIDGHGDDWYVSLK